MWGHHGSVPSASGRQDRSPEQQAAPRSKQTSPCLRSINRRTPAASDATIQTNVLSESQSHTKITTETSCIQRHTPRRPSHSASVDLLLCPPVPSLVSPNPFRSADGVVVFALPQARRLDGSAGRSQWSDDVRDESSPASKAVAGSDE